MVETYYKGGIIRGTKAERIAYVVTSLSVGTIWIETDTPDIFDWNGTAWRQKGGSPEQKPYRWLVHKSGTDFVAKDGLTGVIAITNASATVAIQHALNNLTIGRTWKEVVKLDGDFTITTVTMPSFSILNGNDARLFQQSATNDNMIRNADTTNGNTDIEIIGGTFDGNKAGQSAGGTEDSQSMIYFKKCSNVTIHDGTYKNGDFHNIRIRSCPGPVQITNIISKDPRHEHITCHAQGEAANSCRNYLITNNNISGGDTGISTINIADCILAKNTTDGCTAATSSLTFNGPRTICMENTIRNGSGWGISIAQIASVDYDSSGSIVAHNIIFNVLKHALNAVVQPGSNLTISDNIIDTVTDTTNRAIYLAGWTDTMIQNNIIRNVAGSGIALNAVSTPSVVANHRIKIANNIVYNCGQSLQAGDEHRTGIYITSDAIGILTEISIHDNKVYDIQGSKTQKYALALINTKDCIVKQNDFRNNLTGAILTSGALVNCRFESNAGDSHDAHSGLLQNRKKYGSYSSMPAIIVGEGLVNAQIIAQGTAAGQVDITSPIKDMWLRHSTGATSGIVAGNKMNGARFYRGLNIILRGRFRINQTTNVAAFIGLRTGLGAGATGDLNGDDMLNAQSGVAIGWRSTDTNFMILHNDGTGVTVADTLTPTTAKNTLDHTFEIRANNAESRFEVRLDDNPFQNITADIPAAATALGVSCQIRNTAAEDKIIDAFWWEVEQDRI